MGILPCRGEEAEKLLVGRERHEILDMWDMMGLPSAPETTSCLPDQRLFHLNISCFTHYKIKALVLEKVAVNRSERVKQTHLELSPNSAFVINLAKCM